MTSEGTTTTATTTTWHITWGTYGTRLHGGERPTVDRTHNELGENVISSNQRREHFERRRMGDRDAVFLTAEQRSFVEAKAPALCDRGAWVFRTCAAAIEGDHVHVLLDAPSHVHGKSIRTLLKRWMTQDMDAKWSRPSSGKWWAEGGSTRAVKDASYLHNVTGYIDGQRSTP